MLKKLFIALQNKKEMIPHTRMTTPTLTATASTVITCDIVPSQRRVNRSMKKNSFLRFLEEKRGRKPLSPTHAQDKAFILAQNPNIKPTAMTMAIRGMKAKFMKWIEAHNKELLKNLEDDSLETLQKIITANNI